MNINTKRTICILLLTAILMFSFSLCSCNVRDSSSGKIKILCTVFPIYDWVCAVVGESEDIEVNLLVENGTDLHSFQPSFGDMAKIKDSDIVIYIGGESDRWVAESIDENATALALSELNSIKLYEVSADSIASSHTHNGEECHEAHDHSHGFDEHLWLSVQNAKSAVSEICSVISQLDSASAHTYKSNAESYTALLDELDIEMEAIADKISKPFIFADRFPFVYLLADYGIDYFAAFEGCSTDTGADFDTIITLAGKADEYNSRVLFVSEAPVSGLAEGIVAQTQNKSAQIITLNSMQSLGKRDIDKGAAYLSIMRENINRLWAEVTQ